MKTINVHTTHKVSHADGSHTLLSAGVQKVENDLAEHWYVKLNSTPVGAVDTAAAEADTGKPAKASK